MLIEIVATKDAKKCKRVVYTQHFADPVVIQIVNILNARMTNGEMSYDKYIHEMGVMSMGTRRVTSAMLRRVLRVLTRLGGIKSRSIFESNYKLAKWSSKCGTGDGSNDDNMIKCDIGNTSREFQAAFVSGTAMSNFLFEKYMPNADMRSMILI